MCSKDELQKILTKIAKTAKNTFGSKFDTALLYGSYARGDYNKESDIDIMILVDLDTDELRQCESKICDATYDFNYDHDTEIMPIVQNAKHFDYWKEAYMFYWNVEHEGVAI